MTFIYFEDRDFETGHGWRDMDPEKFRPFFWSDSDRDGDIELRHKDNKYGGIYATCSYFWIATKDYFEERGYINDNIRTGVVKEIHHGFLGIDNMSSHFEFQRMNPMEVRTHLEGLGIMDGDKLDTKKKWK